ncbi:MULTISPECIES: hypothetical protein [unclassified Micromonospora]
MVPAAQEQRPRNVVLASALLLLSPAIATSTQDVLATSGPAT